MSCAVLLKGILVCLFLFIDISTKKLQVPGVDGVNLKTEKLNECGRCKILTDSFNHWLKKTSRGKYEGGDTAWEEAKLKSYARSEIRFVEVQEGLCSEQGKHEHDCYTLAEEAEQALEKWWFHEDTMTVDLHTWLCIETLKYCCPMNHFGESCAPCRLDKNNKICGGHGQCDGEGTRNGNGLCICSRGYIGSNCEECSKNFYNDAGSCVQCDRACDGCSSAGPAACQTCKTGWELISGVCTDVNECLSSSFCKADQYCINKEGSYSCKSCDNSCASCIGPGPLNCTSCEPNNNYLWEGECITETLKTEMVKRIVNRMIIYTGILLLAGILYRKHKYLALLVFLICAIFICNTEKSAEDIGTYKVFLKTLIGQSGYTFYELIGW